MNGRKKKSVLLHILFWACMLVLTVTLVIVVESWETPNRDGVLDVEWPIALIGGVLFELSLVGSLFGSGWNHARHWTQSLRLRHWSQWLWLLAPTAVGLLLGRHVMEIAAAAVARPTPDQLTAYATYATLLIGLYLFWIVGYPLEKCFAQTLTKRTVIALRSIFVGCAGVLLWITGARAFAFVQRAGSTPTPSRVVGLEAWIGFVLTLVLIALFVRALTPLFFSRFAVGTK